MDKKNTFYAFLATGAFATIGGLVGIFSKLLAVLFSAPHDTIQFIGSMVLTVLCLATALSAFGVLLFAMRKIKKISEQEQKEHCESDKRLQELQELQIALLKSKLASITPEGDVVIDNGKMVVDLSNKNIVIEVDSSSQQDGPQLKIEIKSDKAECHNNTDTGASCSANSDEKK